VIRALSQAARRAAAYGSLVKIAHTVFTVPFAVSAAILATRRPHVAVTPARVLAIAVCLVAARSAAMAYNRLVDRDIDARNPRTQTREIPAGQISVGGAIAFTVLASAIFLGAAATLGTWPARLALPVLVVLLGYSHAKRFTWAAHVWLGVALALAPAGAWLAMGVPPEPSIFALMLGVASWIAGFDVLYALQDEEFDRGAGLNSIPARFGGRGALSIARALHVVTVVAIGACGVLAGARVVFAVATALVAGLLIYEHSLVRPVAGDPAGRVDLSRIDKAFFDVNGWVSLGFLALVALDRVVGG
jgi:4-hydroxybenzoate polyprenyltransferase